MDDSSLMTWGKHRGKKRGDVPADYLLWFYDQLWAKEYPGLWEYVAQNYLRLEREAKRANEERTERLDEHDWNDWNYK